MRIDTRTETGRVLVAGLVLGLVALPWVLVPAAFAASVKWRWASFNVVAGCCFVGFFLFRLLEARWLGLERWPEWFVAVVFFAVETVVLAFVLAFAFMLAVGPINPG